MTTTTRHTRPAITISRPPDCGRSVVPPPRRGPVPPPTWDRMHFKPDLPERTEKRDRALPAPPQDLPDPGTWAGAVIRAAAEALAGMRSADQLVRWVSPELHEALARRAGLAMRILGRPEHQRHPRVRLTRVERTSPRSCEVVVLLDDGNRVRAAAARMEVRHGRWIVTRLEIA